jgi:RNA polymerase sigma-70 factor, ECF subfamily
LSRLAAASMVGQQASEELLRQWMSGAAQGDLASFERFYTATAPRLLPLVRRLVRTMDDAEDVLADTYLQAWRGLASYDPARGAPLAWLTTIARTRALDLLRRQKLHRAADLTEVAHQACKDPLPDQQLSSRQDCTELDIVCRVLLSPQERMIVALSYFKDCSHPEIARISGLPVGTVKTILRRAQQKLRSHYCPAVAGSADGAEPA